MNVFRIVVPMVPPSPNRLRREFRHPLAYRRLRRAWEQSLAYGVSSAKEHNELRTIAQTCKLRVSVTVRNSRMYDQDNLTGALKPVLDAMKEVGYLHDDNEEWLVLGRVRQEYAPRAVPETVIEIEAVP